MMDYEEDGPPWIYLDRQTLQGTQREMNTYAMEMAVLAPRAPGITLARQPEEIAEWNLNYPPSCQTKACDS